MPRDATCYLMSGCLSHSPTLVLSPVTLMHGGLQYSQYLSSQLSSSLHTRALSLAAGYLSLWLSLFFACYSASSAHDPRKGHLRVPSAPDFAGAPAAPQGLYSAASAVQGWGSQHPAPSELPRAQTPPHRPGGSTLAFSSAYSPFAMAYDARGGAGYLLPQTPS